MGTRQANILFVWIILRETVSISPAELRPKDQSRNSIQVKKIDYILALSGRSTLHCAEAAITNWGLGNTWSLCQTTHPYHRHPLIVLNMEVKKQYGVDLWSNLGSGQQQDSLNDGGMKIWGTALSCQDLQLSAMTGSSTWAYWFNGWWSGKFHLFFHFSIDTKDHASQWK